MIHGRSKRLYEANMLHPIGTHNFAFMCLLDVFAYFPCDSRVSMWGTSLNLSMVISMGSGTTSRTLRVYDKENSFGHFETLPKWTYECWSELTDVVPHTSTPNKTIVFTKVSKTYFLRTQHLVFFIFACALKCIICSFPTFKGGNTFISTMTRINFKTKVFEDFHNLKYLIILHNAWFNFFGFL